MTRVAEILKRPELCRRALLEIEEAIEEVRAGFCAGSPKLSHAPGGGRKRDLSDYYERVEELIKKRNLAVLERELAIQEVLKLLERCKNKNTRQLLVQIYVMGIPQAEVYESAGRSYTSGYMSVRREIWRLQRILDEENGQPGLTA